jgi:hypothetical protein
MANDEPTITEWAANARARAARDTGKRDGYVDGYGAGYTASRDWMESHGYERVIDTVVPLPDGGDESSATIADDVVNIVAPGDDTHDDAHVTVGAMRAACALAADMGQSHAHAVRDDMARATRDAIIDADTDGERRGRMDMVNEMSRMADGYVLIVPREHPMDTPVRVQWFADACPACLVDRMPQSWRTVLRGTEWGSTVGACPTCVDSWDTDYVVHVPHTVAPGSYAPTMDMHTRVADGDTHTHPNNV